MARITPDCPAAESTGGGRAQNPVAVAPPAAAVPASASPRRASAGPSVPAHPSQEAPRAGTDPTTSAAALDLALGAAADQVPGPATGAAPDRAAAPVRVRAKTPAGAGRRRAAGAVPAGTNPLAAAMSEAELEEQIRDACKKLGIIRIHVYNSRGTTPGVPDDILIGPRGILWRECKTARGKVTAAQQAMGEALQAAGQDWAVWRPEDWFSGRMQFELAAISGRGAVVRMSQRFPVTFTPDGAA